MKFTIATIAALAGAVAAAPQGDPNSAVVINNCTQTIYVQSFPYDGSAAGPLFAVKNGERFAEGFRASGSTIKIAKDKALTKPLQFGYSSTAKPDYAYYEFSNEYGNPFADQHNLLNPGDGCEKFDCKANDKDCYSSAAMKKVRACPKPVTLFAKLCAA